MLIENIQNNFFIYCKHFKTETHVVEQKTKYDLSNYCKNWPFLLTIFNFSLFFFLACMVLNYDFLHIRHDHAQFLLLWKRTHWPILKLCLIDSGHRQVSFISFFSKIQLFSWQVRTFLTCCKDSRYGPLIFSIFSQISFCNVSLLYKKKIDLPDENHVQITPKGNTISRGLCFCTWNLYS